MHRFVAALVLIPIGVMLAQEPLVELSNLRVDTVKRGDIVRMVRGLGMLTDARSAVVKIPEMQAREIQPGQTAMIDMRAGIVSGHVARIDPADADGTAAVTLRLDRDPPDAARPGFNVDATIHLLTLKMVLYIARPTTGQSEQVVSLFRLARDSQYLVRQRVELGLTAFTALPGRDVILPAQEVVEVRSGLDAGDTVVLSDMPAFAHVDRVRVILRLGR
jgi:HlyD family secretion protein